MSTHRHASDETSAGAEARRRFFDDPDIDRLLHVVVALTGEVATLRARLDTHEHLSEERGGWGPADVDAWQPGGAEAQLRERLHAELLARVFQPLEPQAGEAAEDEA